MDKKEFLDVLRKTLNGEVSGEIVEQNIRYYDQYISSQTPEEEARIIEMLGDPRLIAKTIIETEKAAKQKSKYKGAYSNNSYSRTYTEEEDSSKQQKKLNKNVFDTNSTWWQKLITIFILIILVIVLVFAGKIIIGFLFAFGVPILLVILLYNMFHKRD